MILPIGDVVALAAPGVEQPCPFARDGIEQFGREREGFRPPRNAVPRMRDQRRTVEGDGWVQSRAAFIAKIVSCG